jgi:hypothetical protein
MIRSKHLITMAAVSGLVAGAYLTNVNAGVLANGTKLEDKSSCSGKSGCNGADKDKKDKSSCSGKDKKDKDSCSGKSEGED